MALPKTQEELNALMAREKSKLQRERDDLSLQVTQLTIIRDAAQARVGELEAKLELEQSTRKAAEQRLAENTATRLAEINRTAVLDALGKAQLLPESSKWAVAEFYEQATLTFDAEGKIASATYKDVSYADVSKAAESFMDDHPVFRKASLGGSGAPRRGSRGVSLPKPDITKQDPLALADEGWRTPAT